MNIKVKYLNDNLEKLKLNGKGDWVDLYVSSVIVVANTSRIKDHMKNLDINKGINKDDHFIFDKYDIVIVGLGVAMELPIGWKANVYPRSSTFLNSGLLLVNSVGCIDNAYKGDNDEWLAVFYATRNGMIKFNDRLCQFDIVPIHPIEVIEVKHLGNNNRAGFGSSGK